MEYAPMPFGKRSGQPTVNMQFHNDDETAKTLSHVEDRLIQYKWLPKLRSGFARLRIFGDNPFHERHRDGLEAMDQIISPRFVDFEVHADEVERPPRAIHRMADSYIVFVDVDDYNEEAMEYFSEQSSNYGNVQFIFEASTTSADGAIGRIVDGYNIYDSDVWVYPEGDSPEEIAESWSKVMRPTKRNQWNLCNRGRDLVEMINEDDE